jgi:glutaminyl-peptide cyclotransferase
MRAGIKVLFLFTLFVPVCAAVMPDFDGEKAFDYLLAQTDMGPRNPGSSGHRACLNWLVKMGNNWADTVVVQPFTGFDPLGDDEIPMFNVLYRYKSEETNRVMISGHWDTRPRADYAQTRQSEPILGANDGASGVAVLVHLAELLHKNPPSIGVDLAFWDGEDLGRPDHPEEFCQGSRYYSKNNIKPIPQKGIVIDMIGDAELEIYYELYSLKFAPKRVMEIWDIAHRLGFGDVFIPRQGPMVYDDHVPLSEAGIPTINIIDFQYPGPWTNYWHTHEDTPDKCSPESLEIIGKVLVEWLCSQEVQ